MTCDPNGEVRLMIAGVGGRGVLVAGRTLADAAVEQYQHVLAFTSYGNAVRGGECECTVILSDREIGSPIMLRPPTVLILSSSALKLFESRVQSNGTLLIDSTTVTERVSRQDVRVFYVPATAIAASLGATKVANLVLLGAYLEVSKALPLSLVEGALEKRMSDARAAVLLAANKKAVHEGAKFAATCLADLAS